MAQPSQPHPAPLTPRQLEVLELVAKGLSNREIGDVLGISPATAKRHVSAVIEALDVTNRTEAATALHELGLSGEGGDPADPVPGFGARPAIAVLPFRNLSTDPEHAVLAEGIVEDVITRLAAWRWFPVISRSSTFRYDPDRVDVGQVSRDVGARYIVQGSVRPAGESARITVKLTDGESGEQLWAERYDRAISDVFALENEIVDTIVASLEPAVVKLLGQRALPKAPDHRGAWECLHGGFLRITRREWDEAGALFARARELDPRSALALAGLAHVDVFRLVHQQAKDPAALEARVIEQAEQAVALDPAEPVAHMALGWGFTFTRTFPRAIAALERATELNPSLAWAHWARGTARAAEAPEYLAEATVSLRRALRLSPKDPFLPWIWITLGSALVNQGQLDEGRDAFEKARQLAPDQPHAYPMLAACHVFAGEADAARACLDEARRLEPSYSALAHARRFGLEATFEVYASALASVGWEDPQDG